MPTNLYGPNDNFDLESSHVLPALMAKFHQARLAGAPSVEIWGSGTACREFLHVDDLADACLFLMEHYDDELHINVGTGEDLSIRELAETIRDVIYPTAELDFDATKPDGTPRKLLDVSRLHALGLDPLDAAAARASRTTYRWYLEHETDHGTDRVALTSGPMLTILSTPKAFTGLFAVIQRNAIESWTKLEPRPEIILFGRDPGTAEICDELGLRHVPDVAENAHGTPLLSDMFLTGQQLADQPGRLLGERRHHLHADDHARRTGRDRSPAAGVPGRSPDRHRPARPLSTSRTAGPRTSPPGRRGKASASRRTGSTTSCSRAGSSPSSRRSRSVGPATTRG